MSTRRRGAELLEHMDALLAAWQPLARSEPQPDFPLLTEPLRGETEPEPVEEPLPLPQDSSPELFQAHLAAAAEKVMVALYRDLSTDLNERMADEMRRVIDLSISRAVKGLRQQILISVAESLTHSIEQVARKTPLRADEPSSKSSP